MTERPSINKNIGIIILALTAGLLLLAAGSSGVDLYVDWLFFQEVDHTSVFRTMLLTKILSGLTFGAAFLVFYLPNLYFSNRIDFPLRNLRLFGETVYPVQTITMDRPVKVLTTAGGFLIALLMALIGSSRWEEVILFLNSLDVGMKDPVFGRDIGFYLFTLPLVSSLQTFAVLTVVLTAAATLLSCFLRGGITWSERNISVHSAVKRHAGIFCLFIFSLLALHFYIDAYRLQYTYHGFIYGAGYTEIQAKLLTLKALSVLSLISAAASLSVLSRGAFKWVLYPAGLGVLVYIGGMVVYAPLLQKFKVAPNELELETPYIEHNIHFTRFGYDLNRIEETDFDVAYELDAGDISQNDATIRNIRLWDNIPLLRTYSQLQQIRTYYKFVDVDNDRYTIDDEYQQVMLSPRELSYSDLPSKSWINERFVFTHGNGLAMGPVSRITREGLPEFIIKDIPPASSADIRVTRPEIYYGEIGNDYVIVKTKAQEFDYPTSTGNVYSTYEGTGGINISSLFTRTVFAVKFNTAKIFLSSDITEESRIMVYRDITSRISTIAPFILFDSDPYMVVSPEGQLKWIIDCYTISNNLPYSMPYNRNINYIRNSVKAVVDAYSGDVSFFVSDPEDIMIRVYSRAFPGIFRPLDEMPAGLRAHIRYPQGMLEVQARMFASYHMTDPKVFYNKEDLWEIPSYSEQPMEPYNTIMKLPGEEKEEYILLLPYTPSKRDNLAAWLAARCDMPHYGKLIAYVFPRDRLVFGPRQINARIDQDAYISQQITLWGQVGSQVIRGSLLVIPIENSLLYVQPLYLSASDRVGLPELRRVIVAYGNEVVMEDNLEIALKRLFYEGRKAPAPARERTSAEKLAPENYAEEAMKAYEKALERQKQGDWAGYGEQIEELGRILKKMAE